MNRFILLIASLIFMLSLTSCNGKKEYRSNSSFDVPDSVTSIQESVSDIVSETSSEVSSKISSKATSEASSEEQSSSSEVSSSKEPETLIVSLTITGLDGDVIYNSAQTEMTDGVTVFDLLLQICKKNNITIKYSEGYIKSIGAYSQFKPVRSAGWLYRVNGVLPSISCNDYSLHGGEKVEWIFSIDYGKSLG